MIHKSYQQSIKYDLLHYGLRNEREKSNEPLAFHFSEM